VIFERYLQLARDAASSGDRVLSENYLQHADHYFRLVRAMQPAQPPPQQQTDRYDEMEGDEDGPQAAEGEAGEEGEALSEGGDQPEGDFPQGQQQQQFDRGGEGEFRRRRGRRNRFRGEGDREGGETRENGEPREAGGEQPRAEGGDRQRNEGEGRRERRPPRERNEDQAGPEGFSSGPKPAFLRGGND